jgi:hypothetical protein
MAVPGIPWPDLHPPRNLTESPAIATCRKPNFFCLSARGAWKFGRTDSAPKRNGGGSGSCSRRRRPPRRKPRPCHASLFTPLLPFDLGTFKYDTPVRWRRSMPTERFRDAAARLALSPAEVEWSSTAAFIRVSRPSRPPMRSRRWPSGQRSRARVTTSRPAPHLRRLAATPIAPTPISWTVPRRGRHCSVGFELGTASASRSGAAPHLNAASYRGI